MDVTLCLTHACNLRCAYCYAGEKSARRMTWDTAKASVDFALAHTIERARLTKRPGRMQLGFFGGEPLLEWPLMQQAFHYTREACDTAGVRLLRTVTTNLTLLDREKADWFRENRFHVGLSIDGHAAVHDALRRRPDGSGSHAACERALEFFRGPESNGEAILVVDPRTVDQLPEAVEWLIGRDIRRLSLNPNFTGDWTEDTAARWRTAYERIVPLYVSAFRENRPFRLNVFDGKIQARVNGGMRDCDRCGFGENEIAVSAAGHFYPCERLVGEDTVESLRIGDTRRGFYPEARCRILGSRGNTVKSCLACAVRDRCVNWCGCVNHATTGRTNEVAGIVCRHEQLCIEMADRAGSQLFAEGNPAFLAMFYPTAPNTESRT